MPARCRKVKGSGQDFGPKLQTEAPVNGGRNYGDHRSSENKSGYMLGHPVEPRVLIVTQTAVKISRGRAISRKGRTKSGILRDCTPDRVDRRG